MATMARYRHYDPQQSKMIAVSYARQLLPGTFEHALSYLIDNEIDLERFASRFKTTRSAHRLTIRRCCSTQNAGKLRAVLAGTSERIGAKSKAIKRNLTDAESATLKSGHGVVQGYIGVAAADDKCQVIVEAQAHGAPQEHDLLKPIINGVYAHFSAIGEAVAVDTAAFLADAGYHSERGLKALAAEHINGYIADGQMRQRDPRYADAGTHKPASKAKTFQPKDFTFDPGQRTCVCPAKQLLTLNSANATINGRTAIVFKGTTVTCEACPLRRQCLRKPDVTAVRQVAFFNGIVESKLPNPHCRAMREKIDSDKGRTIYAQRMGLIEPVFGHIQQRGLRRFTLRGQNKVDTQWKFLFIVHKVAKLQIYGKIAA